MFPFDLEDEAFDSDDIVDSEPLFVDYEVDFNTGKLTGRLVDGLSAIVQWAILTINTERFSFSQYSWDYGSEINDLIGHSYQDDYIESELNRMLEDCLVVDGSGIESIDDVSFEINDDKLSFSFFINTQFGGEYISV